MTEVADLAASAPLAVGATAERRDPEFVGQ
jgi:hypothetical protein